MSGQKRFALLLAFLAFVCPAGAAQSSRANPKVDAVFKWIEPSAPGCSLAVAQAGRIVYRRGYGMADLDHGIKNTPDTAFHAASLAKQFTAMSIMLLVAENRIQLTDDVLDHIDELKKLRDELGKVNKKITIEQMLHHRSGIRDQLVLATMAGWRLSDDLVARDDVLAFVRRMKTLNFDPGTKFSYSNTNYTLAGLIVERANKQKQLLAVYAQKNIFDKLGMTRTEFTDRHGKIVKKRAYGYRGVKQFDEAPFEVRMPNYDVVGPTNLVTTVEDLIKWSRNFDTKVVGGEEAVSEMQKVDSVPGYGLGLYIRHEIGRPIVEHDGRDAGYRSHLFRLPDDKLDVALLCNRWLPDGRTVRLVRDVAGVFLGIKWPPVSINPGPSPEPFEAGDLGAYVGRYYSDEIDTTYEVKEDQGSLWIERQKYVPTRLTAVAADRFIAKDFSVMLPMISVQFEREKGKVTRLVMAEISRSPRLDDFVFVKR